MFSLNMWKQVMEEVLDAIVSIVPVSGMSLMGGTHRYWLQFKISENLFPRPTYLTYLPGFSKSCEN